MAELEVDPGQFQENYQLSPGDTEMIHGVPLTITGKQVKI
jgi:hypothetical protein